VTGGCSAVTLTAFFPSSKIHPPSSSSGAVRANSQASFTPHPHFAGLKDKIGRGRWPDVCFQRCLMRRSLPLKLVLAGIILMLAALVYGAANTLPHVEAIISNSIAEHQAHVQRVQFYLFWGGAVLNCLGVLGLAGRILFRARFLFNPEP